MKRRKRRRKPSPLCPKCKHNRTYRGGPCPPCLRLLGLKTPPETPEIKIIPTILTYGQRNEVLEKMGYSSYRAYLISPLWKEIRSTILKETSRCWVCRRRKKARQVHHEYYTLPNLSGKSSSGLHAVCRACHLLIEFDIDTGKKRSQIQSRQKSAQLRRQAVAVKKKRARRLEGALRKTWKTDRAIDRELDRLIARDG